MMAKLTRAGALWLAALAVVMLVLPLVVTSAFAIDILVRVCVCRAHSAELMPLLPPYAPPCSESFKGL